MSDADTECAQHWLSEWYYFVVLMMIMLVLYLLLSNYLTRMSFRIVIQVITLVPSYQVCYSADNQGGLIGIKHVYFL